MEPNNNHYTPTLGTYPAYIKFWGTRGSIPVAGIDYLIYGGHTACLEICDNDSLIIIDAGTGIRALGELLLKSKKYKTIHLIIGHTHWDHIIGFPFFRPVYSDEFNIHIYAPKGLGKKTKDIFNGMLDRDYFPVKLEEMRAQFTFNELDHKNSIKIGSFEISVAHACHVGTTLCFKLKSPRHTFGYATDNEVFKGYLGHPLEMDSSYLTHYQEIISFFKGTETIIHEAQYFPEEYRDRIGWGHSSITNATILIKECGIKKWFVTHHDPAHTDAILRKKMQMHVDVLNDAKYNCSINLSYDGLILPF